MSKQSGPERLTGAIGILAACLALTGAPAASADDQQQAEQQEPEEPEISLDAQRVPYDRTIFRPDPSYEDKPYESQRQLDIYGAKYLNITQRPLLELGRELYQYGPFRPAPTWLGEKNLIFNQLLVYGDWRTAIAWNDNGAKEVARIATRLNLDIDYQITATERVHAFLRPLDKGGRFTRYDFGGDVDEGFELELDGNADALFFEGDLGSIWGGLSNEAASFDLPFAAGLIPLLFQNGVWVEDAFTGFAVSVTSLNSPSLDISNMDITFFAGFDKVTTGAVRGDHGADVYGVVAFIEANQGYWELGYGYTNDRSSFGDQSYHNFTASFTRRYGNVLSNSVRVIVNVGQKPGDGRAQTADGFIILVENSLITSKPTTLVPYFNFWAGFDRPQSLARDAGAGGILKNTGILFESDGVTGFPTMDATGFDTHGAAVGLNYLFNLDRQIVLEAAILGVRGSDTDRTAPGNQFGIGMRYQHPISHNTILRFDVMRAWREEAEDLLGVRFEVRIKF